MGARGRMIRKRLGRSAFLNGERLGSRYGAHLKGKLDAQRIIDVLGDLDRMRLMAWITACNASDLDMPPPHIAEILGKARIALKIDAS